MSESSSDSEPDSDGNRQPEIIRTRSTSRRILKPKPKRSQDNDSTVEVADPKESNSSARAPQRRYTSFEDDFIWRTLQQTTASGMSANKASIEVASQLAEEGYERTPGSIMFRWYTKLKKSCPLQMSEHQSQDDTDNTGPDNLQSQTTAMSSNSDVQSSDTLGTTSKRQHQNDPPSTPGAVQTYEPRPLNSLLHVRLGDGFDTLSPGGHSTKTFRAYTGSRFAVDKVWTGASSDVLYASWSPDGTQYIVGSAAQEAPYNRPNNLVLGNIVHNELREIPGHRETTLHDSCTYYTVSSVSWRGDNIFTAGYDGTVKVWDAEIPAKLKSKLQHRGRIVTMAVSYTDTSLLATATDAGTDSLRLYLDPVSTRSNIKIPLPKNVHGDLFSYTATCMKFGVSQQHSNHLLAGFGSNEVLDDDSPSLRGYLGLWRVDEANVNQIKLGSCSQQVFDVAWSPSSNLFFSGNTVSRRSAENINTLVRVYDCGRSKVVQEAACPAKDMNYVSVCPFDDRIFSAAYTNRSTYIWDMRNIDTPLHILEHGPNVSGHRKKTIPALALCSGVKTEASFSLAVAMAF